MNKTNLVKIILMTLLVSVMGLSSCKKHENSEGIFDYDLNSKIPYSLIKLENKGFVGRSGSTAILCFPDMQTFILTQNELSRQLIGWDSVFVGRYKELSTEQLNRKVVELNYKEKQPLISFQDFYNFHSLNKQITDLEEVFLQQDELNIEGDPDNHFIVEDNLRAVLNTDCEVKINDAIYKLTENGYFAIYDGDMRSLQLINNNEVVNMPNIKFIGDMQGYRADDCRSCKRNSGYETVGSHRIKWVVSIWKHPWSYRAIAKIDNYEKTGGWLKKWRKVKSSDFCRVSGFVSGTNSNGEKNCDVKVNFNPNNVGMSYANKESNEHKIFVNSGIRSGWIKGEFIGLNISKTQMLSW